MKVFEQISKKITEKNFMEIHPREKPALRKFSQLPKNGGK